MNDEKLKAIANFGKEYQKEYLYKQKAKQDLQKSLSEDWYEALNFFFNRAFMRGRRDEISIDFLKKAKKVLDDDFKLKDFLQNSNQNKDWKKTLQKGLSDGGVNNQYDRDLVLSTIEFILKLNKKYEHNLINYSLEKIRNSKIEEIYGELDDLTAVGDKIASFFLRDLACIFDLKVQNDKQILLQPIDTWVSQILEKFNIAQKSDIDKAMSGNKSSLETVRKAIITKCENVKISPIEFNQGAWYLGFHAFKILIENLDKLTKEQSNA